MKDNKLKVGRPSVMTPETINKLKHAFSIGCNNLEACAYAEIGESTLYDYLMVNEDFSEQIKRLKEKPGLMARNNVIEGMQKVDNETEEQKKERIKNSQWYLSRKKKDEFGTALVEIKNDNRSIQIVKDDPRVFSTMMKAFENMKNNLENLEDEKS